MSVAVLVPWRGGCPHREAAWEWVSARYAEHHPGWDLQRCEAPAGPWRKGAAVAPALEASRADIVVLADGDVWTDGLPEAVEAVVSGEAPWVCPHRLVHRLSEESTAAVLAGAGWQELEDFTQRPYEGFLGGGIVVASRETLLKVPIDPRFEAWGQEDESHAFALQALAGNPWRGAPDLVHLFHPPQDHRDRRRGSRENWALRQRYFKARRDPCAMRALIEEAVCQPSA